MALYAIAIAPPAGLEHGLDSKGNRQSGASAVSSVSNQVDQLAELLRLAESMSSEQVEKLLSVAKRIGM